MGWKMTHAAPRRVWSSAGTFDIPEMPAELVNEMHIDFEAVLRYIERHWGRVELYD